MTSLPPGYPGYLPDDGLTVRPDGFSAVVEAPEVTELDPDDPLVNPPAAGIDGWSRRMGRVLTANWRPLLAIVAIGYALPTVALAAAPVWRGLPGVPAMAYFQAVMWGATVWTMTQWATGTPPSLGGALAYGFRRSPLLFGLNLLVVLMSGLGLLAFVLPGLYLWFATSLVMPAALYRQERPVGASFGLTHRFVGPVLARAGLTAGVLLLFRILLALVRLTGVHGSGFALASLAVEVVVGAPLQIAAIVGLTLTHIEMTARTHPITSASLLAAL